MHSQIHHAVVDITMKTTTTTMELALIHTTMILVVMTIHTSTLLMSSQIYQ